MSGYAFLIYQIESLGPSLLLLDRRKWDFILFTSGKYEAKRSNRHSLLVHERGDLQGPFFQRS